jgi:type VI secretion system protein ImpJ
LVVLDGKFVPPVLNVRASDVLMAGLRRVQAALAARLASLLAQRARPSIADMTGADALRYWMMSAVGGFLPRVNNLLERALVHPHEVYRVLTELQGAIAAFTPAGNADAPEFNFLDLGTTFDVLFTSILRIVESLGHQQHREIPLRRHDDRLLYAELREPTIFRNEFFLGVVGKDPEMLRHQVPKLIKIAAWDEMPTVVSSAVGGVGLKHEYRAPAVLPNRPGIQYFRLDRGAAPWTSVTRKGTLGVFHPVELGSFDVSLFVVDPSLA